jgi:hypothetical protein
MMLRTLGVVISNIAKAGRMTVTVTTVVLGIFGCLKTALNRVGSVRILAHVME